MKFRLYLCLWVVPVFFGCMDPLDVASSRSASVSTSLMTYTEGDTVQVDYSIASPTSSDWIAIAKASDPDNSYSAWQYTNGTSSGTLNFAGLAAGNYEAREFHNWVGTASYTVHARTSFTITAVSTGTVSTNNSTYVSGASIIATFTNSMPTAQDWIALAPVGSAHTHFNAYQYTNGAGSGSVTFTTTLATGNYIARLFRNNTYTLVAESAAFSVTNATVGAPTLSVPQPLTAASNVIVTYSGMPGNSQDWISVVPAGSADNFYVNGDWTYTSGQVSGTYNTGTLAAGNYEARAYFNWPSGGYTVQQRIFFTIQSSSPVRLIAPITGSIVSKRRPSVVVSTGGSTNVRFQFCANRTCGTVLQTINASGSSPLTITPNSDLPVGIVYFRARPTSAGFGSTYSDVWELMVTNKGATPTTAVASFADYNGDSIEDMATTANRADRGYVFHGSTSGLPTAPSKTLTGTTGSRFANPGNAGDLNGDGFSDLIMGAWGSNSNAGQISVYMGSSTGIPLFPARTIASADGAGSFFGAVVQGIGDVNRDGYGDVVATAYNASNGDGKVYVYHGSNASGSGIGASPTLTLTGTAGEKLGYQASSFTDVNGDGYSDLVVSATGANSNQGRIYVYHGSASGLPASPNTTLNAPGTSSVVGYGFGFSIASGDINGDGYSDIATSTPGQNNGGSTNDGAVYLYLGSPLGLSTSPSVSIMSPVANGFFGVGLRMGDITGNGVDDLVAGATVPGQTGAAYLFVGASGTLPTTPSQTIVSPNGINSGFGTALGLGDYDDDGYRDLAVGAYQVNSQTGIIHVYDGTAAGVSSTPANIIGPAGTLGRFGINIAQ